jgi:hypothetical protein
MLRKLRPVAALSLAVFVLTSLAFSTRLGSITLNETQFEKFGELFFPFQFKISLPLLFALCENGINPTGGCVNNIVSDFVCVTNNSAGEGVAAMISDQENGTLNLSTLPPDFPCTANSKLVFLKETGKAQVLAKSIPTILPTGAAGPTITVIATSDLDTTPPPVVSDTLVISTP